MDESNALGDAEMRLITINGQTIMLEGDFENLSMSNEYLNEMLMINNSKIGIDESYNVEFNGNPCLNSLKDVNDEPTKLEISIQGDNNELETIQIGMEEAKALGLFFCGMKNDSEDSWQNCTLSGVEEQVAKSDEKVSSDSENSKVKLNSVPVISVSCLENTNGLISVNEVTNDAVDGSEAFPLDVSEKVEKINKAMQESNPDSLPAIGHLEGFQIPTSEDGVLLPATVNARMADGSYQTITLVPQVINGAVTYTVHFSNLNREAIEKNLNSSLNYKEHFSESFSNKTDLASKEVLDSEINSVDNFFHSVQLIKSEPGKTTFPETLQKISDKNSFSGYINTLEKPIQKVGNVSFSGTDLPTSFAAKDQVPIETKIDNIISENENVISKCKKVKYGKNVKSADSDSFAQSLNKIAKSNITKAKKVKFKNKGLKFSSEDSDQKKLKMSLLKPNKEAMIKKQVTKSNNLMPHMNLNGRLEYPNLKALEETASPLSYLKVKTSQATKQPYFNVLPYPKDKTIPIQKQILPLSCDLQQAKNLISLQKFLESQKLQLKIQPLASNGNRVINIRPKPVLSEEVKVLNMGVSSNQLVNKQTEKPTPSEPLKENTQEDPSAKKPYQDNMKDALLSDGKISSKFLQPKGQESLGETEKESAEDYSHKLNGIFIKNNPDYFSPKFKDGKADEHPLGSSENPIQLVQTGHTFHSRQPLSEAQLRQIASILQKQKFDSPSVKKNSIFDPKTNTRIVYRVVYPEDVELRDSERNFSEGVTKRKRGRHKTKCGGLDDENHKKPSPLPRGPGRPKKNQTMEEELLEEELDETNPKKIPRTRSGRLSRPPRYMMKDYKRIQNSDISDKTSNSNYDSDDVFTDFQTEAKVPLENSEKIPALALDRPQKILSDMRPQPRTKRNFKPEYRCPTCQKIYLGHTRMMWHLNKFPDHCNVEKYKENYYRKRTETKARRAARRLKLCDVLNSMSKEELTSLCGPMLAEALTIWDFLLLRVNLMKGGRKDEVDALLHELVILLEKLTKIAEDIFLPVFTKEAEKDEDCVEIDRMEVAIALGLPVGFYKVNNDNLNLLRLPLKSCSPGTEEAEEEGKHERREPERKSLFSEKTNRMVKGKLFGEKGNSWVEEKTSKKLEEGSFWLESKVEDGDSWQQSEDSMKTLSTKFEPNLSTKILESSNDSIDDSKYEEPVPLMDLDSNSNSKDVDQSNSSGNTEGSPTHSKLSDEKATECRSEGKNSTGLWNENSNDKAELWNENANREKWAENSEKSELWPGESSQLTPTSKKPGPHLWNENSNLTSSEKVDETNSEFLDSLLSVPNSNEFLTNESGSFLSENITLINEKNESLKRSESGKETKEKGEWREREDEHSNYIRGWEEGKNSWPKEEALLSERMPGVRTAARLTSTPETNGNISFSMPNRRNSISDFSNINLGPGNLDIVLPPAKSLIKDCLKDEEGKFEMKASVGASFLESSDKNWENDGGKPDLNVNSEELMKMALESLTSQHDVINVPSSTFDSAMGILNQSQESSNLNLFTSSETDALDFNLPLPDHLLRSNFSSTNFQTTCAPNFPNTESPAFLSTANNIFSTTCTLSNSIKFDQFEGNQKSKSLDDVMEFLETKDSFNGYESCNANEGSGMNSFPFGSESNHREEFAVGEVGGEEQPKKKAKVRTKKAPGQKSQRNCKSGKKARTKKPFVDYPKTNTIESIINEALFDSCTTTSKSLQIEDSSRNGNSAIPNGTDNYTLPIIPESLDEVENLDFLNQD